MYTKISAELKTKSNPTKAKILARFFKTGKGEYGDGDKFLGIMVPQQRKIVRNYFRESSLADIQKLLNSRIHEFRLTGVLLLVEKYKKSDEDKKKIYNFYQKNLKKGNINNWDLVDLSAPNIIGDYLFDKNRTVLYNMAKSKKVWERRVSILATFFFIRKDDFNDILKIAELLLNDKHDLIHKALGWMLREVGKRDKNILTDFLDKFAGCMPRVMLRYAIEKFNESDRQKYLSY